MSVPCALWLRDERLKVEVVVKWRVQGL